MIENPNILRLFTVVPIYMFTNRHVKRRKIETIRRLGEDAIRNTHKVRERKMLMTKWFTNSLFLWYWNSIITQPVIGSDIELVTSSVQFPFSYLPLIRQAFLFDFKAVHV
jgi:hypothetical protein